MNHLDRISSIERGEVESVRSAGFEVRIVDVERTVFVPYTRQEEAEANQHIRILRDQFQYGVQFII